MWLHIVEGEASLGDVVLSTGDGAGIALERSVSVTARERTELLLINLPFNPLAPFLDGASRGPRTRAAVAPGRLRSGQTKGELAPIIAVHQSRVGVLPGLRLRSPIKP